MTFGRFVGDWDLAWHGAAADGSPVSTSGRLTVGWVLGGRAVQDVWQVPPAAPGDPGLAGHGFHGSTLRFIDPAIDAWRSTWVEPFNARVRTFIGAERDGQIVLLSTETLPHLRWRFTRIETGSFTWIGELSRDGGHRWEQEEVMHATRR